MKRNNNSTNIQINKSPIDPSILQNEVIQQDNISLSLLPTCLDTIFMLPFPFLCVGCHSCLSMTANFNYNSSSSNLILCVFPGYLFCCAKKFDISKNDIRGTSMQIVENCEINEQPAYQVMFHSKRNSIKITGAKMHHQANAIINQINNFLRLCRNKN